jgi:hypothetical protein
MIREMFFFAYSSDNFFAVFAHEIFRVKLPVKKSETNLVLCFVGDHTKFSVAPHDFINDVGVGVFKIVIRVGLFLPWNPQTHGIGIVEKQNGPQDGAFAYTLGPDKMNVAVEVNLRVLDVGTVDKDNSIQVSHFLPLPEC